MEQKKDATVANVTPHQDELLSSINTFSTESDRVAWALPIRYCTVSETEDFMQGQWQIGFFDSGNWEAYRSKDNLTLKVENNQSEKVLFLAQ